MRRNIKGDCADCEVKRAYDWQLRHPERFNRNHRKIHRRAPWKKMHYEAQKRAVREGVPFDLSLESTQQIVEVGRCVYCGDTTRIEDTGIGAPNRKSPTLDRLLPDLGYVTNNIVLACMTCNQFKNRHTPASLRAMADRIDELLKERA